MANTRRSYESWPAFKHDAPALQADAATALAARVTAGFFYRAIYWNANGFADVVDSAGTLKKVVTVAGGVYPLQNCGVVTGGNTTVAQGDFTALYD